MSLMMRLRTLPMLAIDCCGANLMVLLLTDGNLDFWECGRVKVRSRRPLNVRDLCGMSAAGDNLKFSGRLVFNCFQVVIVARPCFVFSLASCCMNFIAFLDVAE